jgi:hypothetical protein
MKDEKITVTFDPPWMINPVEVEYGGNGEILGWKCLGWMTPNEYESYKKTKR